MKKKSFYEKKLRMVNILNIDSQGPNDSENVKKSWKKNEGGTLSLPIIKKRKQITSAPYGARNFFLHIF